MKLEPLVAVSQNVRILQSKRGCCTKYLGCCGSSLSTPLPTVVPDSPLTQRSTFLEVVALATSHHDSQIKGEGAKACNTRHGRPTSPPRPNHSLSHGDVGLPCVPDKVNQVNLGSRSTSYSSALFRNAEEILPEFISLSPYY